MKKSKSEISYGFAYLISQHIPETITGRTMEILEAIGLPKTQEDAVKNLVKQVIYDQLSNKSVYIADCLNGSIRAAVERQDKSTPTSGVKLEEII